MTKKITRRDFVSDVALTGAGFAIVPRHVLGRGQTAPSDRLNVAAVGVGGQGRTNLVNLATENIVALCDVDWEYADKGFAALDTDAANQRARLDRQQRGEVRLDAQGRPEAALTPLERERMAATIERMQTLKAALPRAKRYRDYREMLDRQKDIDGVVIATPDHMHATIALAAMDLGKHVYVQKPLCWSVAEARQLALKAQSLPKRATQMGNQGHSWDDARTAVEYVWAGAIGDVREVHVWTNRPLGYWPQGIPRPETRTPPADGFRWNGPGIEARLANAMAGNYPKPSTLDWDLFLGVAPGVDYHPVYHPFNWRGWVDWGVGAIGHMGAHLIDHALWALDLGFPTTTPTASAPFHVVSFPHSPQ